MQPAAPTGLAFLVGLASAAGPAGAATATIELDMRASGAISSTVDVASPIDDAHLCTAFGSPAGGHSYMLRYAASPAATLLDPGGPALVMTLSHAETATSQVAPHDGSIQVAIGGRRFFGSSQPGAAFRLALSLQPDDAGGSFSARHLVDESGHQTIDLAGEWRCTPSSPAGNTAQPSTMELARSAGTSIAVVPVPRGEAAQPPVAPAAQVAGTAPPASPTVVPPAAVAPLVPPPPMAPVVPSPVAATGGPPAPATSGDASFRHLLAALGHGIAVPGTTAIAPEVHDADTNSPFADRRVFIHYRQDSAAGQAMADRLARQLGPYFAHTEIRTVPAAPGRAEIRYFSPADAAAAHALANTLGSADGPWQIRSFTAYQPRPTPGTLELWVPAR